jgi:hypothetical protein
VEISTTICKLNQTQTQNCSRKLSLGEKMISAAILSPIEKTKALEAGQSCKTLQIPMTS